MRLKAFTLMEMSLVITVIVCLLLLSVPNIQSVLTVVYEKTCDAQLKLVDGAILQYRIKTDAVAKSMDVLIDEGLISSSQTRCSSGEEIHIVNGQASRK